MIRKLWNSLNARIERIAGIAEDEPAGSPVTRWNDLAARITAGEQRIVWTEPEPGSDRTMQLAVTVGRNLEGKRQLCVFVRLQRSLPVPNERVLPVLPFFESDAPGAVSRDGYEQARRLAFTRARQARENSNQRQLYAESKGLYRVSPF